MNATRSSIVALLLSCTACGPVTSANDASPYRSDLTIRYGVMLDDWHGDFLNNPMQLREYSLPAGPLVGQLMSYALLLDARCCTHDFRLFRIGDQRQVGMSQRLGEVALDGRVLEPPAGGGLGTGFVADEPLVDGWYVAAFDARPFGRFGQLQLAPWSRAIDQVAYARFRIGEGVDWVGTSHAEYPSGGVGLRVLLSSPVSPSVADGLAITVSRAGAALTCTRIATQPAGPTDAPGVVCPDLRNGDAVTVSVVSDVIGHPTGRMVPHEFVIDAAVPIVDVAPELGLDLVRAAFGLTGTET